MSQSALKTAPVASSEMESFLSTIAPDLSLNESGVWTASTQKTGTYPSDTHAVMARAEETSFWFLHRNRMVSTLVSQYRPTGPVLDIGGGNGFVSLGLQQAGFPAIVVEPDARGASIAHERGLTSVNAGFEARLFRERSIPAIGLFDVIEHIPDDHAFMKACHGLVADDGMLFATVPAFQALWSVDDEFAKHCRRYNKQAIVELIERSGFDVLFAGYFFSLLVPPLYMLRTLPSQLGMRKIARPEEAVKHHSVPSALSKIMLASLSFEVDLLEAGRAMPFGTSVLLAARKRKA